MVKDTVLYIVRHGESMGNLARRLQGQTDFPLSPLGEEQAALAAQRLAGEPLSAVYASPLKRAHRTAQIIAACHGLPVRTDARLMEIRLGEMEDKEIDWLHETYPENMAFFENEPEKYLPPAGGESFPEVVARVSPAIDEIAACHPGQAVVIVSHGCAIRSLILHCKGWQIDRFKELPKGKNTAVTKVLYNSRDGYRVEYMSDSSHLG